MTIAIVILSIVCWFLLISNCVQSRAIRRMEREGKDIEQGDWVVSKKEQFIGKVSRIDYGSKTDVLYVHVDNGVDIKSVQGTRNQFKKLNEIIDSTNGLYNR